MDSSHTPDLDRLDEAIAEYYQAAERGTPLDLAALQARYPELREALAEFFTDKASFERHAGPAPHALTQTLPPNAATIDVLEVVRYFGDYELLEEVARGGMGVVFRARQVKLDRIVALKMILAGQLAGEDDVRRFHQEARTAAALQHPNIVAIHEVGEHDGQHYFSMDFIDGTSLAQLVRDNPLPAERAVRYVLAAARAVQYAHERGVLHRDLKPANVLIDGFDQPKVTDFGLARRIDQESSLTATGAVVGTPSYMPPEQASGKSALLGPASDVYSLGAVLYELVTGRPPFRAASAFETIIQVLEAEPAPPRLLNPAISRDLETIILKCLRKDAGRRYGSAAELADDLERYLAGEPIRARRPGVGERITRWFRKERRGVWLAARAVLVSLLLLGFGWLSVSLVLAERLGSLRLDTDGMPLRAEVLSAGRAEVLARFRVPHEDPVKLPGGSYRVRLTAPGQLGQTFDLLLGGRGDLASFPVALDDRQPDAPWPEPWPEQSLFLIDLAGRTDLVLGRSNVLSRLDALTRKTIWEVAFKHAPGVNPPPPGPLLRLQLWSEPHNHGYRPRLVRPAPDLDGDGVGDLVLIGRPPFRHPGPGRETIWALSGKTGQELWWRQVDGQVLGTPTALAVPGRKRPDLVATLERDRVSRWVEVFQGDNKGVSRWRYQLDSRWYGGASAGVQAWPVAGGRVVALDGTRLVELAAADGKVQARHELGFRPLRAPHFVDLDGDGQPEALLARKEPAGTQTLVAFSLRAGKVLWSYPLDMTHEVEPLVADLDGDGRPEVVIVNGKTTDPHSPTAQAFGTPVVPPGRDRLPDPTLPWGEWVARAVEVLDGATGRLRWRHEDEAGALLAGSDRAGRHQVEAGPDVAGEGCRAIFTFTRRAAGRGDWGRRQEQVVQALSGKDGRVLWQRPVALAARQDQVVRDLRGETLVQGLQGWWSAGPHAWPLLLVWTATSPGSRGGETLTLLSAGTGEVEHTLLDARLFALADLDGDGLEELCYRFTDRRQGAMLGVLRGGPRVLWRRLGNLTPAGDLDGDGVSDLIEQRHNRLAALSGRDGRVLWQHAAEAQAVHAATDLNGDGAADVLVATTSQRQPGLIALSGKDGKPLWKAANLPPGQPPMQVQCRRIDGSAPQVLLFSRSPSSGGCWFALLDGATGEERGRRELPQYHPPEEQRCLSADLDGDGTADVLLVDVDSSGSLGLLALSGRDASVLWQQTVEIGQVVNPRDVHVLVADLDGDGSSQVVLGLPLLDAGEVRILSGRDGRTRVRVPGVPITAHQARSPGVPPPMVALRPVAGKRSIVVAGISWLGQDLGQVLTRIDQGRADTLARRPIGTNLGHLACFRDVRAVDLDGDGSDELVLAAPGAIEAVRADGKPWWRCPLPGIPNDIRLETVQSPWVVARVGSSLFGIDGRTGRPAWRCEAHGQYRLMAGDDPNGWPRVLSEVRTGSAWEYLLPLPVDDTGRYRLAAASRPPAFREGSAPGRPLPWADTQLSRSAVLILVPFLLVVVCLLRGDLANLLRVLFIVVVASLVVAQLMLWRDLRGPVTLADYDLTGWYRVGMVGTAAAGGVLLPILLVRVVGRLTRGWIRWVVYLGAAPSLLLLGAFALALLVGETGPDTGPPPVVFLLGALVTAVAGWVVLLVTRRRGSPNRG
jgi:outer membrane protein assembly factor BamB/tRNA A-37 threonylcarbamoyl transferase component Bud32